MSRIVDYRVIRELGHNSFSIVEEVELLRERGRHVALKRPTPEVLRSQSDRLRFVREIQLLQRLDHPHIIPVLDAQLGGDDVWFTMPLGDTSLDRLISFGPQLTEEEIRDIFGQVLTALSHAHSRGVLHRDLSPRNIIMIDGAAVVADFGLGRHLLSSSARLTDMGERGGTFGFVAPEQWRDLHEVDQRSDIFALGSILFYLATRENPATHNPRRLLSRFGFIINRCREIDPDRRYSSVADLATDFYDLWELDTEAATVVNRAIGLIEESKLHRSARQQLVELYLRNADDISLYLGTVPKWPKQLITSLGQENPDDFAAVIDVLDGHLGGRLEFEAVDGYTDSLVRIYQGSEDEQVRRQVLTRLLLIGERHNRFYAGRRFGALATSARMSQDILAVRSVILANPSASTWARQWVSLGNLSPLIAEALAQSTTSDLQEPSPMVPKSTARPFSAVEAVREKTARTHAKMPPMQSVGDVVSHPKFGRGAVVELTPRGNDQVVSVDFDLHGPKRLLGSLAGLETISTTTSPTSSGSLRPWSRPMYGPGQSVVHPKFGAGVVTAASPRGRDQEVAVTFERFGAKRLLASLAAMEVVEP